MDSNTHEKRMGLHTPPTASTTKDTTKVTSKPTSDNLPSPPLTPIKPLAGSDTLSIQPEGTAQLPQMEEESLSLSSKTETSSADGDSESFELDLESVNAKLQTWKEWQAHNEQRKKLDEVWKRAR